MKSITYILTFCALIIVTSSSDVQGRGGRGGGRGGGFSRGGGGGFSRPAPSRPPSMSRPSTRPSRPSSGRPDISRPGTGTGRPGGNRPATRPSPPSNRPGGGRPNNGFRPGQGGRPTQADLSRFLDIPNPGSGLSGAAKIAGGAAAGGAAADFLRNTSPGQRPGADREGNRADRRSDRAENRPGADRAQNRNDRVENRNDRRDQISNGNRPDRIEDREERRQQRADRRDEVRDQFLDNHPRYDFWKDHPDWARFRWNRPYRWATWGLLTGWFPGYGGGTTEYEYAYGENIYYEDDQVYYGDEAVATASEYADQAQTLAESAPAVDESSDWLPLGVFAITKDGEDSGPPPTLFLQLAVNKQGIIAGTFCNTTTDKTQPIEGMVDQENQRVAWGIEGKKWPIMETGLSNLTKDSSGALIHFENGETQQWLMVRVEEPKTQN